MASPAYRRPDCACLAPSQRHQSLRCVVYQRLAVEIARLQNMAECDGLARRRADNAPNVGVVVVGTPETFLSDSSRFERPVTAGPSAEVDLSERGESQRPGQNPGQKFGHQRSLLLFLSDPQSILASTSSFLVRRRQACSNQSTHASFPGTDLCYRYGLCPDAFSFDLFGYRSSLPLWNPLCETIRPIRATTSFRCSSVSLFSSKWSSSSRTYPGAGCGRPTRAKSTRRHVAREGHL